MRKNLFSVAFALGLMVFTSSAYPQAASSQNLRLVVPWAAGGGADILARMIAPLLQRELGQTVIVENRPGASGNIGAEQVARSPADGNTLMVTSGNLMMNPSVFKSVQYDPIADFTPVTMLTFAPVLLVKGPRTAAKDLRELLVAIRAKPGQFNYSTSGRAGTPHLAGEMFRINQNINITHIPYNGAAPALADVAGGQVELSFTAYLSARSLIEAGRVQPLAVAGKRRLAALPNVPTFAEQGVDLEIGVMIGLFAPAKMPREVTERIYRAATRALGTPEFRQRISDSGAEVVLNKPEDFAVYVREDVANWKALIPKMGGLE